MDAVNIGIVGLGNVGMGALSILAENREHITQKLGFPLHVHSVCSRHVDSLTLPVDAIRTSDWRNVIDDPHIHIVAELIGGCSTAKDVIEAAITAGKSVVTANKELMALCGAEIWDRAIAARINLAMEASVAGGIPIHAVLREGISGDRIQTLYGILNGTCNYILTEIERAARRSKSADGGATGRLRRSRPVRRRRRLRRAIEAGHSDGAGVRRAHHPRRYLHRRHPPHHAGRFRIRAPACITPSG